VRRTESFFPSLPPALVRLGVLYYSTIYRCQVSSQLHLRSIFASSRYATSTSSLLCSSRLVSSRLSRRTNISSGRDIMQCHEHNREKRCESKRNKTEGTTQSTEPTSTSLPSSPPSSQSRQPWPCWPHWPSSSSSSRSPSRVPRLQPSSSA
jgi:hypothetical protein